MKDCDFRVGKTRLTLDTAGRGKFNLKINGNEVPYGVTAGEAKKASDDKDKLSKFLGDFMQILTVLSKPVNQRIVLGTLDGVLCGMYCFLSKSLMNEEPRLFIDMSFKQRNQIVMYGVSDLIQIGKGVKQQESFIGSNFISNSNNNTEVSSGSSRTEGGGNTNNKNNRGIFGRIFGGNKKPANSGVVNMNVNNAVSVAGSSSGSVFRTNNNNNNVNSKSRRGVKRARNYNVSQPTAKRVVSTNTRNKLIQKLKNKNLSNAVINSYVKSYNNGTKSVNQIIQEVRNNAKRRQNAKNAATLRIIRELRPELF